MFGIGQLGRLGIAGSLFNENALWPLGASSPGLWIDPSYPAACYQDSAGTTALSTVGTVLDSSNPVGLILDRKAGATSKTDPGLHLSQSTSSARPVASARVNFLTYSETLTNAAWEAMGGASKLSATTFAPTVQFGYLRQVLFGKVPGQTYSFSVDVAAVSGNTNLWLFVEGATTSQTPIPVSSTPQRFSCTGVVDAGGFLVFGVQDRNASGQGVVYMSAAQANLGPTALPYQRVGAASDYTATGFPVYAKFDGTDDGLASATFPAGTLTSSMDCLIAVRRDSGANGILMHGGAGASWIGAFQSGGVDIISAFASTALFVDGVQVITNTTGAFSTALAPGSWHIVEFRSIDFSSLVSMKVGDYPGWPLNASIGKILLFASGQDANRDKARARMAAYFGVTLP